MEESLTLPPLRTSEPVFAVDDVLATVKFYQDVLGFEGKWLWGDPPTFAGVRWGKIQILLCRQPELVGKVEGHQHFFRCEDINALHERHKSANAPIISPIGNKPWGLREYTVRDINGYHLRFTGPEKYDRPATAQSTMPGFIRLIERTPTIEEYMPLIEAVGWSKRDPVSTALALRNSLYVVLAVDTRDKTRQRVVGSIRVVGDGAEVFYLQDVMVMPELQHQRVGSAMMESVMAWLRKSAAKGALISLFTSKQPFYERYGFRPGGGMSMEL